MGNTLIRALAASGLGLVLAACTAVPTQRSARQQQGAPQQSPPLDRSVASSGPRVDRPPRVVTLAFAGDVHFELHLAALLDDVRGLGPMTSALAGADLAMVNLESAVTERGRPDPKDLERSADRYWFRTSADALGFLADAGVDVITVANNHGADYGPQGLQDTLRAAAHGPLAVVGVGRTRRQAFRPYRITVHDTTLAVLGADASRLESTSSTWTAGRRTAGLAAARQPRPRALLDAVRAAHQRADVVVVDLHWGREESACPTTKQRISAHALARAGADVVVGSHAHTLLGSGWLGDTYVSYGLGNFVWYHNHHPETGVLRLRLEDGRVVSNRWMPARMKTWGRPVPLSGSAGTRATENWRALRGCAQLSAGPDQPPPPSEQIPANCPTRPHELSHLRLRYVGFDGRSHLGEMVVATRYARDVKQVFDTLHTARWPIHRMLPVDAYDGDDARSMAADNTSGFNCRRVRGSAHWSDHAYGAAIDINPVENPYFSGPSIAPPAGRPFATLDRAAGASTKPGVIREGDLVVRAFAAIGWQWGGTWSSPDYQHFTARPR